MDEPTGTNPFAEDARRHEAARLAEAAMMEVAITNAERVGTISAEIEQLRAFVEDGAAPPVEAMTEDEARARYMRLVEEREGTLPPPSLDEPPPMTRQERAEEWWQYRARTLAEIEELRAFVEGRGPLPINYIVDGVPTVEERRRLIAEIHIPALYEDLEMAERYLRPMPRPPAHH